MRRVSGTKNGALNCMFRGYSYTDRIEKVSDFGRFTPPIVNYRAKTARRSDLGFIFVVGTEAKAKATEDLEGEKTM